MKKIIAILSTISALGFAVALANTNDTPSSDTSSNSGSMSGDTSGNMSGTAPSDTSSSDTSKSSDMSKSSDSSKDLSKNTEKTTIHKHDKWTSAKSCTDENGVTYYKGKTGFSSCVDKMRKSEHHEQMGGTTPSDSNSNVMEHSSDTTIEHSNPSDSSGSVNSPGSAPNSGSGSSSGDLGSGSSSSNN